MCTSRFFNGLGLIPSLDPLSCFPIKRVAGKCNPWLHITQQQGLALGDRSGKISTPGCGPPVTPDLYSTQEGPPLLVPLRGYGPYPRKLIRTPVQGDYSRYHSIMSPPRRASLLVPLPLELSASLPPEVPHYLLCIFCVTSPRLEPQCKTTANWKSLLIPS